MSIAELVDLLKGHVGTWSTPVRLLTADGTEFVVQHSAMVGDELIVTLAVVP